MSELTFSANIRPKNYFNVAVSYSMIQSAGKSLGLALKLGPLFVGTDYMFFGNNTRCCIRRTQNTTVFKLYFNV